MKHVNDFHTVELAEIKTFSGKIASEGFAADRKNIMPVDSSCNFLVLLICIHAYNENTMKYNFAIKRHEEMRHSLDYQLKTIIITLNIEEGERRPASGE